MPPRFLLVGNKVTCWGVFANLLKKTLKDSGRDDWKDSENYMWNLTKAKISSADRNWKCWRQLHCLSWVYVFSIACFLHTCSILLCRLTSSAYLYHQCPMTSNYLWLWFACEPPTLTQSDFPTLEPSSSELRLFVSNFKASKWVISVCACFRLSSTVYPRNNSLSH